jgi:hypothetical protein
LREFENFGSDIMTTRVHVLLLALCLGGPGCTLTETAVHNTFLGPHQLWDEHYEDDRNRTLAIQAWQRACGEAADTGPDYRDGFVEGYADFLKYGGNGEPPAVAPARYRNQQIRSGTGWSAARCWIDGFRHGARAAQANGQRLCPPTALACDALPLNPYADFMPGEPQPIGRATSVPAVPAIPSLGGDVPMLPDHLPAVLPIEYREPPLARQPTQPRQPDVPFSREVVDDPRRGGTP